MYFAEWVTRFNCCELQSAGKCNSNSLTSQEAFFQYVLSCQRLASLPIFSSTEKITVKLSSTQPDAGHRARSRALTRTSSGLFGDCMVSLSQSRKMVASQSPSFSNDRASQDNRLLRCFQRPQFDWFRRLSDCNSPLPSVALHVSSVNWCMYSASC